MFSIRKRTFCVLNIFDIYHRFGVIGGDWVVTPEFEWILLDFSSRCDLKINYKKKVVCEFKS